MPFCLIPFILTHPRTGRDTLIWGSDDSSPLRPLPPRQRDAEFGPAERRAADRHRPTMILHRRPDHEQPDPGAVRLARCQERFIERAPRPVTIHRFDVMSLDGDQLVYRAVVESSAGTYVRTLGADLGAALGGGAHIRNLRRTASGVFAVDEAQAGGIDDAPLLPVLEMVRGLSQITVDGEEAVRIGHGASVAVERALGDGPWAIVDTEGTLLAVHERVDGALKVGVVLAPAAG